MAAPANHLQHAKLREIRWKTDGQVDDSVPNAREFEVQFNPESLKLAYNSTKAGGDQSGGSAIQYVGQGTTKLTMDLVFDASRDPRIASDPDTGETSSQPDVRNLTQQVIEYIRPKEADRHDAKSFAPPGLRVQWGTFLFEGVVDSVNETLDYWTEDGRPLQAKVSVSMSRQEINVRPPTLTNPDGTTAPGTAPLSQARSGDSVAGLAGRDGAASDWKQVAAANGIENPRALGAGTLLNLKAGVSVGVTAGVGVGASASFGGTAGFGASGGFALSAGASGGIRLGGTTTATAGTSASLAGSGTADASTSLAARLTSRAPSTPKFRFDLGTPNH